MTSFHLPISIQVRAWNIKLNFYLSKLSVHRQDLLSDDEEFDGSPAVRRGQSSTPMTSVNFIILL
jgi:hypothetical protein